MGRIIFLLAIAIVSFIATRSYADQYATVRANANDAGQIEDGKLTMLNDGTDSTRVGSNLSIKLGIESSNHTNRVAIMDFSAVDSVGGGATIDSCLCSLNINSYVGQRDSTIEYEMLELGEEWHEEATVATNPAAVSHLYRDSTATMQLWTTPGGGGTQVMAKFMTLQETLIGGVDLRMFDSAGTQTSGEADAGNNKTYGILVPLQTCNRLAAGTIDGILLKAVEEDTSNVLSGHVLLNSSEASTESRRVLFVYYGSDFLNAVAGGPPNQIHSGRIHGPGGSSLIHGKPE